MTDAQISAPNVDCPLCRRQTAEDMLVVYESENWIARHSRETNLLGYIVLESRRHILDLSEASTAEAAEFGFVLKGIISAIKQLLKPERVYTVSLAEVVPHLHVHVIPRTSAIPRAYKGRGILSYPLSPGPNLAQAQDLAIILRHKLRRLVTPLHRT